MRPPMIQPLNTRMNKPVISHDWALLNSTTREPTCQWYLSPIDTPEKLW
ncbi:hypothetical protein LCGC14_1897640 [marine sediment metagenome]|uniref:Uncharacterized protein n=1 Tax=marine sediment metagenome TaxID=412755 RepID=A0A0F9FXK2_9ZZZZ